MEDKTTFNANGLGLSRSMDFVEWARVGHTLSAMENGIVWWIGDWLNYGEHAYGEKYAQALQETGRDRGALANIAWVASRFEPSRRRDGLTYSHHAAVASLERVDQDRVLDAAEKHEWGMRQVQRVVREIRRERARERRRLATNPMIPGDILDDMASYAVRKAAGCTAHGETCLVGNEVVCQPCFVRALATASANWCVRMMTDAKPSEARAVGLEKMYPLSSVRGAFGAGTHTVS